MHATLMAGTIGTKLARASAGAPRGLTLGWGGTEPGITQHGPRLTLPHHCSPARVLPLLHVSFLQAETCGHPFVRRSPV